MREEQLNPEELQLFRRRDFILKSLLALPIGAIAWRLWDLQIKQGEKFHDLSQGNRIRINSVGAPRGSIYDRNGVPLAQNIPGYNLMLVRDDCKDIPGTLAKLANVLKIPLAHLEENLERRGKVQRFEPIPLYKDLTWYQMALVSSYQEEFPGVNVEVEPRRYYPLLSTAAHVLGYMSQVSKAQMKDIPEEKRTSARMSGQDGIERIYNPILIGTDGGEQVEVNSEGRVIQRMDSIDPIPGKELVTTLDSRLQKQVETVLAGRKGSCVLMNPQNGEIYSMLSLPSFDPNEFSQGLSTERWQELSSDPDHPLNNKAIQGVYSPGSTFKMAIAGTALELGIIDRHTRHVCEGAFRFNNLTVHCWNHGGHGSLNVSEAIENSCNIFFYKVGLQIGVDRIKEYTNKLGLGLPTGVDLYHELTGVMPSSAWKQARYNQIWYQGETLPVSIGQGYVSVTPLQLLGYINTLANGGYRVQPRLVRSILDRPGELPQDVTSEIEPVKVHSGFSQETLDILVEAMVRNVNGNRGTGRAAQSQLVTVAGKTGTTQVVSHKTRDRLTRKGELEERYWDHAWFVAFAPAVNPRLSGVMMVENGKAGGNAARLMKEVFEYYFTEIDPEPGATSQTT